MNHPKPSERIAAHIETALARALSGMTGEEFSVNQEPDQQIGGEIEDPIVWQQSFSFNPELPAFWLVAGRNLWAAAGQLTLAAVGIEQATDEDCRATWQEIAGQTMGGLATALTSDLEREIRAVKGEETAEAPAETTEIVFSARRQETVCYFKAGWLPALEVQYDAPADLPSGKAMPEGRQTAPGGNNFSKTFDLLLDVALPVSVSFGRTSLQIREVLKLNTGSIVELNRLVVEPVDVIVNDCVIARGEVVVVDGNYGVRVTQLASREDRLRFGMAQTSTRVAAGAGGAA